MPSRRLLTPMLSSLMVLASCAISPSIQPPQVPAALQTPAGQSPYLQAFAVGVQIYECAQKADTSYGWVFKAPEATLASSSGEVLGKHYAGPTWESTDGSRVVGEVKAKDPGPDSSAVPWLLLAAKSNTGSGAFAGTKSIQRVATVGGVAPSETCTGANLKQLARIPYTATYYFYQ